VRRLLFAAAVALLALGCGNASATSGGLTAKLVTPPAGILAGSATTATIRVTRGRPARNAVARIRFASADATVAATARATGRGTYSVRFRLPVAGAWAYRITIGRAGAGKGQVDVRIDSRLPGAEAFPICPNAGAFWPTETLALDFGSAWIACKEIGVVRRFDLATSRPTATMRLGGSDLIGVTTGFGSVWALDGRGGTLTRIDPDSNRVVARISLPASKPYNVWTGVGAVWVADDGRGEVVRIDPTTNQPVASIDVGDGPADLAFEGSIVWVINHRDRGLVRIDAGTNATRLVATIPGDAPERMVFVSGHLWITGRGTDLLEVDPDNGNVLRTVEIGAGGIDIVASGNTLWVPSRNGEVDARGFPTMEALRRIDAASGAMTASIAASAPLDVHGLVADAEGVWLADNTHGVLYRVRR
jgi:DNA-binding beta-propeller fold protein YncE